MLDNFLITLQISALGMGLVFGAIFLLWGLIAVLVKLAADRTPAAAAPAAETPPPQEPDLAAEQKARRRTLQARAAAAAVAVALTASLPQSAGGIPEELPNIIPLPPTSIVSAWQAVMRGNMLNKRGPTR